MASDKYDFNTLWTQGISYDQGFQFDNQPVNIVMAGEDRSGGTGGGGANGFYNDIYQLSFRLQNKQLGKHEAWLNWIEKIQPDYRFLTIDEQNATTAVFANVDDPWMFTQYIFKGVSLPTVDEEGKGGTDAVSEYTIIEPPLFFFGIPKDTPPQEENPIMDMQPANDAASQLLSCLKSEKKSFNGNSLKKVREDGWQTSSTWLDKVTSGVDGCFLCSTEINVQSVKWGQHGNIPPHVVNMIAPPQYMDVKTTLTLRAITKNIYGSAIYLTDYGLIMQGKDQEGDEYSVIPTYQIYPLGYELANDREYDEKGNLISLQRYSYSYYGGPIILKGRPQFDQFGNSPQISIRVIGKDIPSGSVIEKGCKYWGIVADGVCGCTLQRDMNQQQKNNAVCSEASCLAESKNNSSCPYYTPRGAVVAFRYQLIHNGLQFESISQNLKKTIALAFKNNFNNLRTHAKYDTKYTTDINNVQQKKIVTYETVQQPLNGVEVHTIQGAQYRQGATIVRGTGQSAFDLPGFDTKKIYYNDMSQINYHRWMNKILPCYDRQFCNDMVGEENKRETQPFMTSGCSYMDFAGTNQVVTNKMPYCPYYKKYGNYETGCPYGTVNKNAMDYAKVNKSVYDTLHLVYGIAVANTFINQIQSAYKQYLTKSEGQFLPPSVSYRTDDYLTELQVNEKGLLIVDFYYAWYSLKLAQGQKEGEQPKYIRNFSSKNQGIVYVSRLFGLQQSVIKDNFKDEVGFKLCSFRIAYDDYNLSWSSLYTYYNYYLYNTLYTKNSNANTETPIKKWLVMATKGQLPQRQPLIVDNEIKFQGGYHPQYMRQKIMPPQQIVYKKTQPLEQQYSTFAKADSAGTGSVGVPNQTKTMQFAHFIQEAGQWLLEGEAIGDYIRQAGSGDSFRAAEPALQRNGGVCIGNRWENSFFDPTTGERKSPQIVNCNFYLNDTEESINLLRQNPPVVSDPDTGKQKKIRVNIRYPQALPYSRTFAKCDTCKVTVASRFQGKECPWCKSLFRKVQVKTATHIPRTKAMGRVILWGLPGTIIKTKSYFWKSPTTVSASLVDQIVLKLGNANIKGGGYQKPPKNQQNIDRIAFNPFTGRYVTEADGLTATNPTTGNKITPYSQQGLQMITVDYISSLRNRVQPLLGYIVGRKNASSGDKMLATGEIISGELASPTDYGEYKIQRTDFKDRKNLSYMKYWAKKRCVCPPIVSAYSKNSQGKAVSCFVQYPSGDETVPYLIKYYPPDYNWWEKRGYIGGLKNMGITSPYHFGYVTGFSPEKADKRLNSYSELSNTLTSQIALPIAGYLPDDKEFVAAYVVFNLQQQDTYCESIGQVQYPSNAKAIAYLHWHPTMTDHETGTKNDVDFQIDPHKHQMDDNLQYPELTDPSLTQQEKANKIKQFKASRKIFDLKPDKINLLSDDCCNKEIIQSYIDKYGDKFYIDPISRLPIYWKKFKKQYPQYFAKTEDIHQFAWTEDNVPYVPLLKRVDMQIVATNISHEHEGACFGLNQCKEHNYHGGIYDNQCLKWDGFGTDIIQTKPQNSLWKNYTVQQFEKLQQQYLSQVTITIKNQDGQQVKEVFYQYYDKFNHLMTDEMQSISGYFDYSSFNTLGKLPISNKKSEKDRMVQGDFDQFIVVQADSNSQKMDAGKGLKVIDITSIAKSAYEKKEKVSLIGYAGESLQEHILGLANKCHILPCNCGEAGKADIDRWNNRDKLQGGFYNLINPQWYPELNEDGVITVVKNQQLKSNNNKIAFYANDLKSKYNLIQNSALSITVDGQGKTFNTTGDSVTTTFIAKCLQQCVGETVHVGVNEFYFTTQKEIQSITISGLTEIFSIQKTTSINTRIISSNGMDQLVLNQNRIAAVFFCQFHPYVVYDLIQAPFLAQRRDYLKQPGHVDYDSSYCENDSCLYKNVLQGVVQQKRGGVPNGKCLACGSTCVGATTIGGDGIATWVYSDLLQEQVVITDLTLEDLSTTFITLFDSLLGASISDYSVHSYPSYSVFVSSSKNVWNCILNIKPNKDNKLQYCNLYSSFENYEKLKDVDWNGSITFPKETDIIRARYAKLQVQPGSVDITFSLLTNTLRIIEDGVITIPYLEGVFVSENAFVGDIVSYTTSNGEQFRRVISSSGSTLYVEKPAKEYEDCIVILNCRFFSFSNFKLGGGGYLKNSVAITPKANVLTGEYTSSISLNILPIKFYKVSVINGVNQIILKQINLYANMQKQLYYDLQVVEQNFVVLTDDGNAELKTLSYYKIKSGSFYFDIGKRRILLPEYGLCADLITDDKGVQRTDICVLEGETPKKVDGKYVINLSKLNITLVEAGIDKQVMPESYFVKVWDGTEGGVDIKFKGKNGNVNEQISRGSKITIASPELPKVMSTPLADATGSYTNYQAINTSAISKEVPWVAYNKQNFTISAQHYKGYFEFLGVNGINLSATDGAWDKLIANNSCFVGDCQGQITFKGTPSTCIAGNIECSCKNSALGYFVIIPHVDGTAGRITNAYLQPYAIVYLKQKNTK